MPDTPDASTACLERARTAPLTQSAVAELGTAVEQEPALAALDLARRELDEHAVTVLLCALAAAGKLPASAAFAPALALVAGMDQFVGLLGMSPDDPTDALLELLHGGTLSRERECLALYVLTERWQRCRHGEPLDPRICEQLRHKLRSGCSPESAVLLALAASKTTDAGVRQVALAAELPAPSPQVEQRLLRMFRADWRQFVPAHAPQRVQTGTARRAAPKVQRNDPCPCGSGKKYKKCCEGKEDATVAVTVAPPPSQEVWHMRPAEVARLDLAKLDRPALVSGLRVALRYNQWQLAERVLAVLDARIDDAEEADDFRCEFLDQALEAGAIEVVDRNLARARDPQQLAARLAVRLDLLRPDAGSLARLEAKAFAGLRGESEALYDLAFGLLDHAPALGILVARGALDPARTFDSWQLLEDIEMARDRLQLPPDDPMARVYESMLAEHADAAAERAEGTAIDRLARSLHEKQRALEATQRESAALQRRMQEANQRIALLEQREAAAAAAPAPTPAPDSRTDELERELQRLRNRVGELKGLVSENMERRKLLERQLAAPDRTPAAAPMPAAPAGEAVEDDIAAEPLAPRAVCVPVFADAAARALRALERSLSSRILRAIVLVAAADPGAWRDVKALRGAPGHLRLRVGQYRILFHQDSEQRVLTVEQIVVRGDLDETVRRLD